MVVSARIQASPQAGSAILLKLPGSMGSLLMDCGEGSWGQMLRCLGPEVARQQFILLERLDPEPGELGFLALDT
eukprot:scaffold96850_cov16-Tisochrysis_lutea.AAC.1